MQLTIRRAAPTLHLFSELQPRCEAAPPLTAKSTAALFPPSLFQTTKPLVICKLKHNPCPDIPARFRTHRACRSALRPRRRCFGSEKRGECCRRRLLPDARGAKAQSVWQVMFHVKLRRVPPHVEPTGDSQVTGYDLRRSALHTRCSGLGRCRAALRREEGAGGCPARSPAAHSAAASF